MMRSRLAGALLAGLLAACAASAASSVLYRYVNEHGVKEMSYTLPADQASRGYERIDPYTGRVLESVPPELPPEIVAEQRRQEAALAACHEELDRIYALYGTERDIAHAEREALAALDTRIAHTRANAAQARRELERLRRQAADAERRGRQIAPALLGNIRASRERVAALEAEIEQRRGEQAQARKRYARELARFRNGECPEPEESARLAAGAAGESAEPSGGH